MGFGHCFVPISIQQLEPSNMADLGEKDKEITDAQKGLPITGYVFLI